MHASSQLSNSAMDNDRLSYENMLLKLKLLYIESYVGSDISSLHEASFAEEMHNTIKARDIVLEKAKLSLLSLQTENQALGRYNQAKQTYISLLNEELTALRQYNSELRDKYQNQYYELVYSQQTLIKIQNDTEKMQTEMRQKEFLIGDLYKRFCNMEYSEKDFNTQFTQHLKAVDLGYQEQMAKLRQTFADQTEKMYSERQTELDKYREKAAQLEDALREAKSALGSKTNENEQLKARLYASQAAHDGQKYIGAEMSEKLKRFDYLAADNEYNKLKIATAEYFAEELKKKVAELIQEKAYYTQTLEKAKEKHEKLVLIIKYLQSEAERHYMEVQSLSYQNDTKATYLNTALYTYQTLEKEVEYLKQNYKQLVSKNEITDRSLMYINNEFYYLQRNHYELYQYYSQIKEEYDLAVSTLYIAQKEQSQTENLIYELRQNGQKYKLDSEENAHEVYILTDRMSKFKASIEAYTQTISEFSIKNSYLMNENTQFKLENDRLSKDNTALKERNTELAGALSTAKIQVEYVSSEYNYLQTQFYLLTYQNQYTEAQFGELLQDKEKAEYFAARKSEKYLEAQSYAYELYAFYKQITQQVRLIHQQMLSKLGVQSSIYSPKSSMVDSQNKSFELYSLLGEIKTRFFEISDLYQQKQFEILQLNDKIASLQKEVENQQAQVQYHYQQCAETYSKYYNITYQETYRYNEVFQLKAKLQETEATCQQALEQRNQLKQQKYDYLARIDDLTRKLKEAKSCQESQQTKLALEAKQIQEYFSGQIRNFYNKCMVINSLEELKNEINALYVRIGV